MVYMEPGEYARFGLSEETGDAAVLAASAMIDAHCRRPSLGVCEYTERFRFAPGCCAVRVSAGPVVSVVSARIKTGCVEFGYETPLQVAVSAFGLGPQWMNVAAEDVSFAGNEVRFVAHALGDPYDEAEVTYTAGFAVAPDAVKVACAQIVRNAEAMPALNVKRQTLDSMQMEYFSGALLDESTKYLLRPFVALRIG